VQKVRNPVRPRWPWARLTREIIYRLLPGLYSLKLPQEQSRSRGRLVFLQRQQARTYQPQAVLQLHLSDCLRFRRVPAWEAAVQVLRFPDSRLLPFLLRP